MPNAQTFHDINQGVPSGLFSVLMQEWGYGSLGNMDAQRIAGADEHFSRETNAQAYLPLDTNPHTASPRSRLANLKAMRFTHATKTDRVHRSLNALDQPLGIDLSNEQWALVAELTEADEE